MGAWTTPLTECEDQDICAAKDLCCVPKEGRQTLSAANRHSAPHSHLRGQCLVLRPTNWERMVIGPVSVDASQGAAGQLLLLSPLHCPQPPAMGARTVRELLHTP